MSLPLSHTNFVHRCDGGCVWLIYRMYGKALPNRTSYTHDTQSARAEHCCCWLLVVDMGCTAQLNCHLNTQSMGLCRRPCAHIASHLANTVPTDTGLDVEGCLATADMLHTAVTSLCLCPGTTLPAPLQSGLVGGPWGEGGFSSPANTRDSTSKTQLPTTATNTILLCQILCCKAPAASRHQTLDCQKPILQLSTVLRPLIAITRNYRQADC